MPAGVFSTVKCSSDAELHQLLVAICFCNLHFHFLLLRLVTLGKLHHCIWFLSHFKKWLHFVVEFELLIILLMGAIILKLSIHNSKIHLFSFLSECGRWCEQHQYRVWNKYRRQRSCSCSKIELKWEGFTNYYWRQCYYRWVRCHQCQIWYWPGPAMVFILVFTWPKLPAAIAYETYDVLV